jgi:hypothetical protein
METCMLGFGRAETVWSALALLTVMSLLSLGLLFSEHNRSRFHR